MLKGIITHINSTKYIVNASDKDYICTPRGIFRNKGVTPFVGDHVIIDETKNIIDKIEDRKNSLIRPNIANVDIGLIVVSVKAPDLDLLLLDKLISETILNNIKPVLCFTKLDLLNDTKEVDAIIKYYNKIGISAFRNTEVDKLLEKLKGKIVVCFGQTGSGKSTFINKIDPSLSLETSPISSALGRGVHTTRYVSLYKEGDFYIADSPGFSALDLSKFSDEDIRNSFIEFKKYDCKYNDCSHIKTDGCKVEGNKNVLPSRYDSYIKILKENHENSRKLFSKWE